MTSALVFVDTNVFAYALDRADTTKQRRAQAVIHEHSRAVVVSTQILFELYAVCTRKLGMDRDDARAAVRAVANFPVTHTDRGLAMDALQLAASAQLSIFDAAIVCAAAALALPNDPHRGPQCRPALRRGRRREPVRLIGSRIRENATYSSAACGAHSLSRAVVSPSRIQRRPVLKVVVSKRSMSRSSRPAARARAARACGSRTP